MPARVPRPGEVEALLARPWWALLRDQEGVASLPLHVLRRLDAFLRWMHNRKLAAPVAADFLAYASADGSPKPLQGLFRAFRAVLPRGLPTIEHELREALRLKAVEVRRRRRPPAGAARPRALRHSVPEAALPEMWRERIADMRAGEPANGQAAPAPSIVDRRVMKLRQLAWSASRRGLPVCLSLEAAQAYYEDLTSRKKALRAATMRASFEELWRFARYAGLPEEICGLLHHTYLYCVRMEHGEVPLKFGKLVAIGSLADSLALARGLLEEARTGEDPRAFAARLNEAAALALFSILPLRLADTRLDFGQDLSWDGERYHIHVLTSKCDEDFRGPVHPGLNAFIDPLILRGAAPQYLDELREACMRSSRPVFVKACGTGVGYGYVSDIWRRYLETGAHISRTRVHTELARLGPEGVEMALALCAQRSPKSAEKYHAESMKLCSLERSNDALFDEDEDAELEAYFGAAD